MTDPAPLSITEHQVDATTVVGLSGELDLSSAPALRTHLLAVVAARPKAVVIDLEHLQFLDSTGISLFVVAQQRFAESAIALRLCAPNASVRRLLSITKLDGLFSIYDTLPEALDPKAS